MSNEEFISINKVAEAKGLKSNRSLRLEINKPESKYIAREVKVNGGTSYLTLIFKVRRNVFSYIYLVAHIKRHYGLANRKPFSLCSQSSFIK